MGVNLLITKWFLNKNISIAYAENGDIKILVIFEYLVKGRFGHVRFYNIAP